MKVLVLTGDNHRFGPCATVIEQFLSTQDDLEVVLTGDAELLASGLAGFDVLVHGLGFTRSHRDAGGTMVREPALTAAQEQGLLAFVHGGKGLVGVHGTGWWIGGEAIALIGGHANWHPPGCTFTVQVDDASHAVTAGLTDFEVDDEIYMSAWDPSIHILASAEWSSARHPMAWVKPYGNGRVFYTTLGHAENTYQHPSMQRLLTQGARWAGGA